MLKRDEKIPEKKTFLDLKTFTAAAILKTYTHVLLVRPLTANTPTLKIRAWSISRRIQAKS